jgi:NAD(P)-dependent dehydrogenase (short-subunit alcohol dehydrogenase family)
VLLARNADKLKAIVEDIARQGGNAQAVPGDVTKFDDVSKAIDTASSTFGSVDVLVNNAGVIDPIAHLGDSDVEAWGRVVDINLKGVYHGLRAAIPKMVAAGGGTVINISSGAATGALEGWSHYCSTKAAVLSLTRCVHKEYADHGITVVGLSPGTVATNMQTSIRDSGVNPVSKLDWGTHIPAEWVAQAIAYLAGDGGKQFAGTDFLLKNDEGRRRVGLPLLRMT